MSNINSEHTKHHDLPGLPLVRWGFRYYSAQSIQYRRWSLYLKKKEEEEVILHVLNVI